MTEPLFPCTNALQTPNPPFWTTKTVVPKFPQNGGSTPTRCLDKAVHAQGGGGVCGNFANYNLSSQPLRAGSSKGALGQRHITTAPGPRPGRWPRGTPCGKATGLRVRGHVSEEVHVAVHRAEEAQKRGATVCRGLRTTAGADGMGRPPSRRRGAVSGKRRNEGAALPDKAMRMRDMGTQSGSAATRAGVY